MPITVCPYDPARLQPGHNGTILSQAGLAIPCGDAVGLRGSRGGQPRLGENRAVVPRLQPGRIIRANSNRHGLGPPGDVPGVGRKFGSGGVVSCPCSYSYS